METESRTTTSGTKISDSAYSNSGSNTDYQGSAYSKSRRSGSNSSGSSGYCDAVQNRDETNPTNDQLIKPTNSNETELKKQKSKSEILLDGINIDEVIDDQPTLPIKAEIINALEIETTNIDVEPAPIQTNNTEPLIDTVKLPNIQLKETTTDITDIPVEPKPAIRVDNVQQELTHDVDKTNISLDYETILNPSEDNFCCIISMYDGIVLYTTPSLTNILGFPKDMWLGRSFIDFIHPKDRETFSTQITTYIALPLIEGKENELNCLYVCLRKYGGFKKNIYGVVEQHVSYQAFRLTVSIRHIANSHVNHLSIDYNNGLFLVVVAVPLNSSYKIPVERKNCSKFGMRHTATCIFNHVDPEVVTNFGFLPQDMLGKSVFDFYHPEDMPLLKEVYKSVIEMCQINGSVFRSKPYRFLVQNGGFVMVETEWSSIVNPWSRKLELVIGLHKVLQGPLNPNVFDTLSDGEFNKIPEEAIKEGKVLQTEIIDILNEELPKHTNIIRQDASKRCEEVANFVESIRNDVKSQKSQNEVPPDADPTISERDSVLLGEISPHHDYYDSKSSSETPPSYNQLNYNENICRFFQSNPKTTVSDESNSQVIAMETDSIKNIQECTPNNQKCLSPVENNSRASRSGSAGNLSSESNPNMECGNTSGTNMSNDSYKPPHLTKSILVRHNEDMEKIMIQRHKEERFFNKDRGAKKYNHRIGQYSRDLNKNPHSHGLKRSGSHSMEGDCPKFIKQHHDIDRHIFREEEHNKPILATQNQNSVPLMMNNESRMSSTFHTQNGLNMWPSFQMPSTINPQIANLNSNPLANPTTTAGPPGMIPFCYMPLQPMQPIPPRPNYTESDRYPVQYMPAGVFYNYNSIYPTPAPMLYPIIPVPMQTQTVITNSIEPPNYSNNLILPKLNGNSAITDHPDFTDQLSLDNEQQSLGNVLMTEIESLTPQFQRPSSQATSIKAEPGSIASASVANKALSECSRKDLGLQSVCSPDSPLVSPPDGETQTEHYNLNSKTDNEQINDLSNQLKTNYRNKIDEDSSCYSSSYSSFFKTETGSGSNDDSGSSNKIKGIDEVSRPEGINRKRKTYPLRNKGPPWTRSVSMTSDLIYRYQVPINDLQDVLKTDRNTLKEIDQPMMVNDQLQQLYIDLELEGLSKVLTLEEGCTSSSSSGEESASVSRHQKKKKSYNTLVMIYEENAPLPSPEDNV